MPTTHTASVTARCTNVRGRCRRDSSGAGGCGDEAVGVYDCDNGVNTSDTGCGDEEGILAMLRR